MDPVKCVSNQKQEKSPEIIEMINTLRDEAAAIDSLISRLGDKLTKISTPSNPEQAKNPVRLECKTDMGNQIEQIAHGLACTRRYTESILSRIEI